MEDTGTITADLFTLQDLGYRDFIAGLIPTADKASIIGVRSPALKKYADTLAGTAEAKHFLQELPHHYYEENMLHANLLNRVKNMEEALDLVRSFLPYIDNWAVSDALNPAAFALHKAMLVPQIRAWLDDQHTYTVRFAVGMLMNHFLDKDFDTRYLEWAADIRSQEYYINMMAAWFFATALTFRYEETVPYLIERRLPVWNHNKTIQKAVESRRIDEETKSYLKTLRIRRGSKA